MATSQITTKDLQNELRDMRERFPSLKDDELFVAWFMKCFVTDTEDEGVASVIGGTKDKSLDAIHIDDSARKVFIVQGKYRHKMNGGSEKRNDILGFADVAGIFGNDEEFKDYRQGLAASTAGKAEEARKRIKSRGYRIQLYFVTTGKCSSALVREANGKVRRINSEADIDIIDGKRVLRLLSDYLDGVAPPVPSLELELEGGQGVTISGVLQRFDQKTNIESWVVPVSVDQIARMYEDSGIRLFARNVRGFLGDTQINRNMKQTLEREPEFFWYYNNGITIVCDDAEQVSRGGNKVLRLVNPQVINGQQTTRTLHESASRSTKATVMVRVISVARDTDQDTSRFENLVSRIVAATNWQNAIRASDLMANDRRQVELERNLRKLDYQYLRKRQSKGEARRNAGVKHRFVITKEELAQVVAASDLDPLIVREGKEKLFEERYYAYVFPKSDPAYYLPRYWLGRHVSKSAKGFPERAYAKWLVLHFVWQRLSSVLGKKTSKELFREHSERRFFDKLDKAINAAFKGASTYYRANRGSGAKQIDPSVFFKRANHHTAFEKFWESSANKHRASFGKAWKAFAQHLIALEHE
jgi:hypothetical protein